MPSAVHALKRLVVGRPRRSEQLHETLLSKRIALPVFASDPLSSVAYAPDEIFIMLSIAGLTAYSYSWKVGLAVVVVMFTVVASYRQNVHAYPSGGGDYEVAGTNLGNRFGKVVASALLVDYVLTVAVSISSGVQNAAAAMPFIRGHETWVAVGLVVLLMAMNLRGIKEAGTAFAVPTYLFVTAVMGMIAWGFGRYLLGDLPQAESARFTVAPDPGFVEGFTGLAAVFLILRTFSSGSAALTGVEAISNGVPAFRKPKSRNAATTLLLMGVIAVTMEMGILGLANLTNLRYVDPEDAAHKLLLGGEPVGDGYTQTTVMGQLGHAVFDNFPPGFYFLIAATGVILILAANTAFSGFPVLGSILARDGYLPKQLHTRGDRLAFSNGIVLLAGAAIVLIVAFDAEVTRLIQLYIVGVFVSFTVSQTGMVRHWTRLLRTERSPDVRRRMQRSRAINAFGLCMTGTVLVIVLVTKFTHGAWIAIAAMFVLYLLMSGIQRHYGRVNAELTPDEDEDTTLPSRVHAIVLVSRIHRPALRAVSYARATRPDVLEAVSVQVDPEETRRLQEEWDRLGLPVRLKVLDSPYREMTRPFVDYLRTIRRSSPRDVVTVFLPEYVVGHWWEQVLHNQSALRLKARLLFEPGIMVTNVPWQLSSSHRIVGRLEREAELAATEHHPADTRE
ncbi:MAG: amino acid permease [Streptosporangiales bacterium]|nr:amino acid permease [Streptosporangiales bacterium]